MTLARTMQVPLSMQDITRREIDAVLAVLTSDRLSIGPRLEAFEDAVARRAGRAFAVGVNSGTSALHLCVKGLGLQPGDEVITTPFSFIATTNCLLFEQVQPVFVDIDPLSYNLNPDAIEAAITPRTAAILPVEAFGNLAHFDRHEQIARRRGLAFIEDCCEALGGRLGERPAGSFGQCGAFAFYPNKQITTGEGGMLVTDDPQIRDLARSLRNQGRATDDWLAHARLGYNYRLSELAAALGEVQMVRLDDILECRRRVARLYHDALADLDALHLPAMAQPHDASWFVYVVRLADDFSAQDRDAILARLRQMGVGCNNYFSPIHLQPYIVERFGTRAGQFPRTEHAADRTIALPFFSRMSEGQVAYVADALADAIDRPQ
ncbi:MAG: UDP-4-amino-4-deoxy-L-arabinose--oxoglutarate aminotransferase [Planctomycetes bacterium ADurb.Bin126]|nr:MAG: UDP-4-amino-4-deoxy-L-arabinose--oxoglutarate aminotransferase [Planctomycetes bacterium ADurb.Bin126]HOD83179.1 DegT/DnrJ/EryC1/StrS family aminotransferase [Phycisphaerae bacterium]HQL75354.1 DegT/DnrJ/EryC1/StrS family aminotransferase [Phycisphaerae bacterium]